MPSIQSNRKGLALSKHNDRTIPRNSSALTKAITVVVNGRTIGYIQSLKPTEGRHIHKIHELGHLDMVEQVPGGMSENSIQIQRMMLYQTRLVEVFDSAQGIHGNDIEKFPVSLLDFNVPFDIEVFLTKPKQDDEEDSEEEKIMLEKYVACWFVRMTYELKVGDEFQVIEEADINYTAREGKPLMI